MYDIAMSGILASCQTESLTLLFMYYVLQVGSFALVGPPASLIIKCLVLSEKM